MIVCDSLYFECSAIINTTIGAIIGFVLSIVAALFFEKFSNRRKLKNLEFEFKFLESNDNQFDWRHWNVYNGRIEPAPIDSYMRLKYLEGKKFEYQWIENEKGRIEGEGMLIMEDITHGYISYFSINTISYGNRKIFYRIVNHQNQKYDAIFVDAADDGYKYVLMRKK